jgi:hypothetical protein
MGCYSTTKNTILKRIRMKAIWKFSTIEQGFADNFSIFMPKGADIIHKGTNLKFKIKIIIQIYFNNR